MFKPMNLKVAILLCCLSLFTFAHAQHMVMHSESPEAIDLMNEAMETMGHDMQRFEDNLHKAVETDPNMVMANFFQALDPEKKMEESKVYVEKVMTYEGEMSEGEKIVKEICSHFGEENFDLSAAMEKLVEAYPEDYKLQLIVGAFYLYGNNPEKGMPFLKTAAEKGKLPGAYNMLGYGYMGQGNMEMAKAQFEAYASAAPNHYNSHDSMGDFYMANKQYKEAAEQFEMAAKLNPDLPLHAEKAQKAKEMMEP